MTPFQLAAALGVAKSQRPPNRPAGGINENAIRAQFEALKRQQEDRVH